MSKIVRGCILGFLCIILALSFNTAYGRDLYNFEASTEYLGRESDNYETRDYGFLFTSYFKKVNVSNHPLAEAAFLERASSISLPAGFTQFEYGSLEGDGPVYGAEVTYIHPERPIYTSASFYTTDIDVDSSISELSTELSIDEFNLGIGMFIRDNWLVAFHYGHSEADFSGFSEVDDDLYTFSTKWVNENGDGTALNIEANLGLDQYDASIEDVSEDGLNTIIGVAGDYYFNPRMSVGGGLTFNTGDDLDAEGSTLEIRSSLFFNPRFSIRAGFEQFLASNDGSEDEQTISFNLATRF